MAQMIPSDGAVRRPVADAVPASSSVAIPGWPKGVNNVQSSEALSLEWLRSGVNIDLSDVGKITRRTGCTKTINAVSNQMHSLWGNYVVDGSALYKINSDLALSVVQAGLAVGAPMAYLELNGDTYFTNGVTTGVIQSDGTVRPWGVPVPAQLSPGVTTGTLAAGRYSICATFVSALEEGGASRSTVTSLLDGQALVVALPTTFPTGVAAVNLYVSAPDGTVEYLYGTYVTPGQVVTVNTLPLTQRECQTKFLSPPPAGSRLMYYRGRIYLASGKVLYHTEPLRYGAVRMAQNFMLFPTDILMLAATKEQDGFFVSDTNEHYFVEGSHEEAKLNFCAPYPAIPNTYTRDSLTDEPVWFTSKGWVTGKTGGQLEAKMALSVAVPQYESGAALYREEDGLRQYVSSFPSNPEVNGFSASDYIEAEVIRKGD